MISYKITATAITKAPPERIFAVIDDFGRWPTWMPAFSYLKVELPPSGQPSLGYRFRLRSGLLHTDMEVVDFGPLSRATKFRISFPPFTGMNRCLVRPLANGRYRIERVDSLDLPEFLAGLISTAQRAKFDRLAQDFLVALTAAAESED